METERLNKSPYLSETRILDFNHPAISKLIARRGWSNLSVERRIQSVYEFVRDEIRFGYNRADDIPASEILKDGYGQCNTKGTLFMALLRAVGIPCRIHGFTIDKGLQKGAVAGIWYLLAPREILHSWVEVQFGGRWINLEGFILDKGYLSALRDAFPDREGTFFGFGVATDNFRNPPIEWSGWDTYIQSKGIVQDFGVFSTPDEFYSSRGVNLAGVRKLMYESFVRHRINKNVERIRSLNPACLARGNAPGRSHGQRAAFTCSGEPKV